MIEIPSAESLTPQTHRLRNGRTLFAFPTSSIELVKIDFLYEAGTAYQPKPLVAAAANSLYSTASSLYDARRMPEFLDYRGIHLESSCDVLRSSTTVYTHRRHLDDLFPVLEDMLHHPAFEQEEFEVYRAKRRQNILAAQRKSSDVARKLFYNTLFGDNHPMGRYAVPEDADRLDLTAIKEFHSRYCRAGDMDIVIAGNVDERTVGCIDSLFGSDKPTTPANPTLELETVPVRTEPNLHADLSIKGSVQTTIRVGRILPLRWDDPEYARFMLLTTILGGYFGSRLMSNLREDKGYTYGIYAATRLLRGVAIFFITADVAQGAAEDAERQILLELQRLADEKVPVEELELAKMVFVGNFLRSVDGIFERSERFCDMLGASIDERFTDNLRAAVADTTPEDLHRLAAAHLLPETMTVCRAGAL